MRKFPRDLAKIVVERWDNMMAGDYVTPPCPPLERLRELLELAQLTAGAPEEARYPQFNIIALPTDKDSNNVRVGQRWLFNEPRDLSMEELRRLATTVDIKKSAIWTEWSVDSWKIVGLVDLGTSWHRARMGLEYPYEHPTCLLVQIEGPGRMRVYQGEFHVATLSNGTIQGHKGIELDLSLHPCILHGMDAIEAELELPQLESGRDYREFLFSALSNTFIGIANSISLAGHGGAVIVVPSGDAHSFNYGRLKYPLSSNVLRTAFINFMNARTKLVDVIEKSERKAKKPIPPEEISHAELKAQKQHSELVEATRFVAHLSGCDGAIVLSCDLKLLGFGCEITAEMKKDFKILAVKDILRKDENQKIDLEQFGMRHRSGIKLVSAEPSYLVLVISQDGPISAIWSEDGFVCVRKSINLLNRNMPWA